MKNCTCKIASWVPVKIIKLIPLFILPGIQHSLYSVKYKLVEFVTIHQGRLFPSFPLIIKLDKFAVSRSMENAVFVSFLIYVPDGIAGASGIILTPVVIFFSDATAHISTF
ncbi:hypothetical protein [Maridesulfovibrio sp.]|uniref:hypothetical protein n=1 Tax=Maridesulfovibrio sp. TaxID=2795000 RepID=UPI002A18B421|nr:hypothetical protein [Maridesulfovibrio sp.]